MTSPHPFAAWVALTQSPTRPRRAGSTRRRRRAGTDGADGTAGPRLPAQRRPDAT